MKENHAAMNNHITANQLPLEVREHLMRGQQEAAVAALENTYHKSKAEAEQLIADYRENLRQRQLALEIQVMNEQNNREEDKQRQLIVRWVSYTIVIIIMLILLYIMLS